MRFLDRATLLGAVVGLSALGLGHWVEGGRITSLLQPAAFFIVMGGTIGAVILQSPLHLLLQGLKLGGWVLVSPHYDFNRQLDQVLGWSYSARRNGLLALEGEIEFVADEFQRKGLQMLVDGFSPETLRETLEIDIATLEEKLLSAARIWDSAAGYAPTMGILGAVMGLIQVMQNLTEPAKLGPGIAIAFVATIYGVGSANLLFMPIANKLKTLINVRVRYQEMYLDGLVGIATGDSPHLIQSRLNAYTDLAVQP